MTLPIVYDVLIRSEVQAQSELEAVKQIAEEIHLSGIVPHGIHTAFEVIRDDSLSTTGKDDFSRHVNGFVVFSSEQRNRLIDAIARAVDAAEKGDRSVASELLTKLDKEFDYLEHRHLLGVDV
jgi:hypothetical protein